MSSSVTRGSSLEYVPMPMAKLFTPRGAAIWSCISAASILVCVQGVSGYAMIDLNPAPSRIATSIPSEGDNVFTEEDLDAYAEATMKEDASVETLTFTKEMVELRYRQKGKFLALVSVNFPVRVRAHADGTVEVDYPWYSFITVDNEERIATEIKIAVDTALKSRTVGRVVAEGKKENPAFTAAESVDIAEEIQRVLRANVETGG